VADERISHPARGSVGRDASIARRRAHESREKRAVLVTGARAAVSLVLVVAPIDGPRLQSSEPADIAEAVPSRVASTRGVAVPGVDENAVLIRGLYPSLRRFAGAVAGDETEPDDLLQEAVTRALQLRPLTEYDDLGAYLRRTMLNLASNSRRGAGRRRRALMRLHTSTDHLAPADDPCALMLLDSLAPSVRAVLYLAEVERWPYAQIGEALGCTEAAARRRASRGRRALRTLLEADDA
jgi:DNA-directed RNA polymerase specialized sigma24 family protein